MRLAAQLRGGGFSLLPERRVLKAAEVRAISDARALLEDAAAEAARIRASAEAAFEEEKRRGYEEGLESGRAEIAQELTRLSVEGAKLLNDFEVRIPDVVVSAIRQILGTFDDTDLVVQAVKQALRLFYSQSELTIRVAPDRLEGLRSRVDELLRSSSIAHIDVVADRNLNAGDCIVESELGSVNAGIEAQLAVLQRAMRKELGSRGERATGNPVKAG